MELFSLYKMDLLTDIRGKRKCFRYPVECKIFVSRRPVAQEVFISKNLILSLCKTMLLRNNIITNRPMLSRLPELIKKIKT